MSPAQFLSSLQKRVPAAVLLVGDEAYQRRRVREAMIRAHLGEDASEDAITVHDLSQETLAEVIDDARAMSLFVSRRLLRVLSAEAVLPRGSAAAAADDDDEDGGTAAAPAHELDAYLKDPVPGVALLFEATRFGLEGEDKKKTERVRKFFAAIPDVVELARPSADEARRELDAMSRKAGVRIEPDAAELMVEGLGADIARIATELEKLALYAGGARTITVEDVAALIPDARSSTIFLLVAAMGRRDRAKALQALDTLCRDGEYLPLALSFLSAQFRYALIGKEANLRSSQQVQGHFQKMGIPMWPSRAEQVYSTISRFSTEQLKRGMVLIFEADRDLRSARPDDRIVMEDFVVRLTAA